MIGFEPSLFVDEPYKTYTLSWKRPDTWRKNGVCRLKYEPGAYYYITPRCYGPIHAFAYLISCVSRYPFGDHSFRLSCAGKLVARQATYQGV